MSIKDVGMRFLALEGLRGMAALVVVLHHFLYAFYPALLLGTASAVQHSRFEDNILGTPLTLLYSGSYAVAIFFVLSGFVLTIRFFQTKDENIIKRLASKRYLRLMLPALAITLICLLLIKIGFAQAVLNTATITGSTWLSTNWSFDANFFNAIYSGMIGIFTQSGSQYNNVLWTMVTEFIGSFIIFAFIVLFGNSKYRWVSYILACTLTFNTWFLPFILGMSLADLYALGVLEKIKKRIWAIGSITISVAIVWMASNSTTALYKVLSRQFIDGVAINYSMLFITVAATLLVLGVLISKRVTVLLSKPKISNLGKYTFSLYLIHVPVLFSFTTSVFLWATYNHVSYNLATLVAVLMSLPVLIVTTVLFERYVDMPSVKFSAATVHFFEREEGLNVKKYLLKTRIRIRKYQSLILKRPVVEDLPLVELE